MAKYKINWIETVNLSGGKQKKNATLLDAAGQEVQNVGFWAEFPGYEGLAPGVEVDIDVVTKGNYKTAYASKKFGGTGMGTRPGWNPKPSGAVEAANITKTSVETSQTVKHEAISIAGAKRDATLVVVNMYAGSLSESEIKDKIEYWYRYFLSELGQPF